MGAMYLDARKFSTLAHTSSIPIGAMYLYMQERFLHSLTGLRAPIFTLITEVRSPANQAIMPWSQII